MGVRGACVCVCGGDKQHVCALCSREVGEDKWRAELCLSVRMRWQPPELSDHSSKRLLRGLWLLEVEKLTGSKEARAQREGNSAYSKGSAQLVPLIALHYLILI